MIESFDWRRDSDPRIASVTIEVPPRPPGGAVDVEALGREIEDLRRALESRPVIDQAKGILMCRYGIDSACAFAILQRWSMDANIKLRNVAEGLIEFSMEGTPGIRSEATRYVRQQMTGTEVSA